MKDDDKMSRLCAAADMLEDEGYLIREAVIEKSAMTMHGNADWTVETWANVSESAKGQWRNAARALADAGLLVTEVPA